MDTKVIGYVVTFTIEMPLALAIDTGLLQSLRLVRPVIEVRPLVGDADACAARALARHEILMDLERAPADLLRIVNLARDGAYASPDAKERVLVALDGAYYGDEVDLLDGAVHRLAGVDCGFAEVQRLYRTDDWRDRVRTAKEALLLQFGQNLFA